ncbi:hypothetical protein LNP25_11880 [Klebsiella variicola subsp. variicola]|nr:hypothetical protein [Klebsiella variicola subsp. variicola]
MKSNLFCQPTTGANEDELCQSCYPSPYFSFGGAVCLEAGRNTWWFAATLTVLGLFVVLNITLYASDYFTGDGINDAVLYT